MSELFSKKIIDLNEEISEEIKVLVYQPTWDVDDFSIDNSLYFIKNIEKSKKMLDSFLKIASDNQCDLIIMPELSVPKENLQILKDWSEEYKSIVVAGSHYENIDNKTISISPIFIQGERYDTQKIQQASQMETSLDSGNVICEFKNTKCGNFAVLICADFMEFDVKRYFTQRDDLDILIIIAFQADSERHFNIIQGDMEYATNSGGQYIIYSNNVYPKNGDGNSSIFGIYKKNYKVANYKESYKYFGLVSHDYFLTKVNLKNKIPPRVSGVKIKRTLELIYPTLDTKKLNSDVKSKCKEIRNKIDNNLKNVNNYLDIFENLHHGFEHTLISIEDDLRDNNTESRARTKLTILLNEVADILNVLFGDVSVHIKLMTERTVKVNDRDTKIYILKAIARSTDKKKKSKRSIQEQFLISEELDCEKLKTTKSMLDNQNSVLYDCYNENCIELKVNSAYNTVCNNRTENFICNDLPYATENNYYYSSSSGYEENYKSLIIYPIINKADNQHLEQLKGLFIIDSFKKGTFDESFMNDLGGYLTHRFNRIIANGLFDVLFKN